MNRYLWEIRYFYENFLHYFFTTFTKIFDQNKKKEKISDKIFIALFIGQVYDIQKIS